MQIGIAGEIAGGGSPLQRVMGRLCCDGWRCDAGAGAGQSKSPKLPYLRLARISPSQFWSHHAVGKPGNHSDA